jgi:hypothetical protein
VLHTERGLFCNIRHHLSSRRCSLMIMVHVVQVYMGRGSSRLHTAWIPWAVTPVELGGLVVMEGSSRLPGFARMRETYGEVSSCYSYPSTDSSLS